MSEINLTAAARSEFVVLAITTARTVTDLIEPRHIAEHADSALGIAWRVVTDGWADNDEVAIRDFIGKTVERTISSHDYEIDRRLGLRAFGHQVTPPERFALTAVVAALSAVLAEPDREAVGYAANAMRAAQTARERAFSVLLDRYLPEPQDDQIKQQLHG